MSFRSGFFNSKNHDKQYYASDISKLFDSLINPGVFGNVGNKFIARPGEGMQVIIPSGMAWFNSTWTLNDSDVVINIDEAPAVANYSRIDAIFLRSYPVNDITARENGTYYMKGAETSATPVRPVPTVTDNEIYTPICYILVSKGDTSVTSAMITNMVGTSSCQFITGILETVDVTQLLTQWEAQWNDWITAKKADADADWDEWFDTTTTNNSTLWSNWFESVKADLATVEVGDLKNKVDAITGMYVQDGILYLPNTAASVSGNKLILGTPTE